MNICLNCKKEFIPPFGRKCYYCSDECKKKARNKKHNEKLKKAKKVKPIPRIIKCNSQKEQEEDLHSYCEYQKKMREQGKKFSYGDWQTKKFFGEV